MTRAEQEDWLKAMINQYGNNPAPKPWEINFTLERLFCDPVLITHVFIALTDIKWTYIDKVLIHVCELGYTTLEGGDLPITTLTDEDFDKLYWHCTNKYYEQDDKEENTSA